MLATRTAEAGTFDKKSGAEQMKAIDAALRQYFEADDWLAVRDEKVPALKRKDRI